MDDGSEIASRIGTLAVYIDARGWDDLLELFVPEVQVDYTSLFGGESQSLTREQLIANWQGLVPGFTRTTHLIGPPMMRIDGETAEVAASVTAWHWIDDPALGEVAVWIVHGTYEMTLRKRDGVWRFAMLALARAWVEGNRDLPRIAEERLARGFKT